MTNIWRAQQCAYLGPSNKIHSLGRKEISCWLKTVWDEFSTSIITNSFKESGHVYENGYDYDGIYTDIDSDGNDDSDF